MLKHNVSIYEYFSIKGKKEVSKKLILLKAKIETKKVR